MIEVLRKMQVILIFILVCQLYTRTSDGAAYTAMTRLRDLALMEKTLVQSLDELITREKSKLDEAIKVAEKIKSSLGNRNISNPEEVYSSPIEVYTLFKRFVYEWKRLEDIIKTNKSEGKN